MNTFILVQILGAITLIIAILAMQQKTKEKLLLFQITSFSLFLAQYAMTGRITAAVIFLVTIIRGGIFYYYAKKNLKPSIAILIVFESIIIVSTYLTWQNFMSAVPLIATTTNTWGILQDNMRWTRRTSLLAQTCWLAYNITATMYTGALAMGFQMASTIIAMWRYDFRKKRGEL